jgi:serine O-acetyltransferase
MTVIMHPNLQRSLAFILANKLQSSTLLGTQLTRLFVEAYEVCEPADCVAACTVLGITKREFPARHG